MGDHDYAHDNMRVRANGGGGWSIPAVTSDVDAAADVYVVRTFPVTVTTGGLLQLEFSDVGGPVWVVNAVTISP
jgi:hypothetical protein